MDVEVRVVVGWYLGTPLQSISEQSEDTTHYNTLYQHMTLNSELECINKDELTKSDDPVSSNNLKSCVPMLPQSNKYGAQDVNGTVRFIPHAG